jgi:hypothetical protein
VTRLDAIARRRVGGTKNRTPWLWDGHLVPGGIGVLDGDPGLGKSMVTTDFAARVSKGGKWPDNSVVHGGAQGVLFIASEDSPEEIAARCDAAGGDLSKIIQLSNVGGETPSLPRDIPTIRDIIRENNIRLVIIDPIMVFLGVHSGSDQQIRKAVAPLADMAKETGVTVIMVRHLTKGGGKNAKQAGGGSMGLIGQCRFGYLVGPDPDKPKRRIIACTKMNVTSEPASLAYEIHTVRGKPKLVWESKPVENIDADDLMRNRKVDSAQRNEREEAVEFLRDTLMEEGGVKSPVIIFQLAKEAGFTTSQVRTAKGKLNVRSRKLGAFWFWCMPESDIRNLSASEAAALVAKHQQEEEMRQMEAELDGKKPRPRKTRTTAKPSNLTVIKGGKNT